ncbi:universal stress protein [Nocardioides pyridinolyticus]
MTSKSIVVGLDDRSPWQEAVDWAVDQAVRENRALTLVHVTDTAEEIWHDTGGRDRRVGVVAAPRVGDLLLDQARSRAVERAPDLLVHAVLRSGAVRDELLAMACEARMLVVGSRRHRTVWSRLFGTTGSAVTSRPPCPVVVVHGMHPGEVRRGVLVGIDDTEHARTALRFAFEQASTTDRPLTVVHVGQKLTYGEPSDEPEQRLAVAEAVAGLREEYPDVPVRTTVERGDPPTVLLRLGKDMHLIVLGTHHRRPMAELLLGSVVVPVVERATCPVAVVPDDTHGRRT